MSYKRLLQMVLKVLSLMVIGSAMAQSDSSEDLSGVSSGGGVIQEHREKHTDRKDRFKERRTEHREKHTDRKDRFKERRTEHREKHADRKDRFKERRTEHREKHADRKNKFKSDRSRSHVQKSGARVRTAGRAKKVRR